jgi:hypothetical protein
MYCPSCGGELKQMTDVGGRVWHSCQNCDAPPSDLEQRFLLAALEAFRAAEPIARSALMDCRLTVTIVGRPALKVARRRRTKTNEGR